MEVKMEEKSRTMIYVLKEVMKLPVDKEKNTIKTADVFELIERLSKEIPEKDVEEFMKEVKAETQGQQS
jgi:phage-related protein